MTPEKANWTIMVYISADNILANFAIESLKQLKRGDRIQTIGGILGNVLRVEENRIEVKVDETNNTKMWFTRNAIHRVIDEDKADVK